MITSHQECDPAVPVSALVALPAKDSHHRGNFCVQQVADQRGSPLPIFSLTVLPPLHRLHQTITHSSHSFPTLLFLLILQFSHFPNLSVSSFTPSLFSLILKFPYFPHPSRSSLPLTLSLPPSPHPPHPLHLSYPSPSLPRPQHDKTDLVGLPWRLATPSMIHRRLTPAIDAHEPWQLSLHHLPRKLPNPAWPPWYRHHAVNRWTLLPHARYPAALRGSCRRGRCS